MEPHSWIYVLATLLYFFFLSQVIDRNRQFLIKKSRIHLPNGEPADQKRYADESREHQKMMNRFRTNVVLLFMIIPTVEITAHLLVGEYIIIDQLLSLGLFVICFASLWAILLGMKARVRYSQKRYTGKPTVSLD